MKYQPLLLVKTPLHPLPERVFVLCLNCLAYQHPLLCALGDQPWLTVQAERALGGKFRGVVSEEESALPAQASTPQPQGRQPQLLSVHAFRQGLPQVLALYCTSFYGA